MFHRNRVYRLIHFFNVLLVLLGACSTTDAKTGAANGSSRLDPSTSSGARAALMMRLSQTRHRLGPFQWRADSVLSAQAGNDHRSLTETFFLETDGLGRIHGRHDNSKEYGYEFYWAGGTYTYRLRYRPFRRRKADWEDVSSRAERIWNTTADTWSILDRFAQLEATSTGQKGQIAYRVSLSSSPRPASSHEHRAWAKNMKVSALSGRLVFERATGAPLLVRIKATYRFPKRQGTAQVTLSLNDTLTRKSEAYRIQVPEAPTAPIRRRPQEDRRILLGPTPKPGWYRAGGPTRWWRKHHPGRRTQRKMQRHPGSSPRQRRRRQPGSHPRHTASPQP